MTDRHAKYVGLAVAVGIGSWALTTPSVAWAEDPPSTSTSDASESTTTASESTVSTGPSKSDASPADTKSDEKQGVDPAPSTSPTETEATLDNGVIVRSSGGAVTSAPDNEAKPSHSDDDTDVPDPDDTQRPVAPADKKARNEPRRSSRIAATPETRSNTTQLGTSNGSDGSASRAVDDPQPTNNTPVTESVAAKTVIPMAVTAAVVAPAPTPARKPVPDLRMAPATVLQTAARLLNVALAPLLGPGPATPPDSPLLWGLLAWARRQFGLAAPTTTAAVTTAQSTLAATSGLPADLERTVLVSGLDQPLDFRFLPNDGGILIAEKNGAIKLYHDGHTETVITLPTSTGGERGIGGIEVDPDFETNHYLYASYTTVNAAGTNVNRLSRLTLSDDLHAVDAERVILELSEPNPIHHGGTIRFGPVDHMLYWSTGENNFAPNAQDLSNLHGKIIRIDPVSLKAAAGNPFLNTPGARPEIFAYGLRNPFRFTFTPDGKLLVGDVGSADWEELNLVTAGANYGWPLAEGNCSGCGFVNPIYTYPHTGLPARAGAITSVLYYTSDALGEQYQNRVFISDYTLGWIKMLTFDKDFTSLIDVATFDDQAGIVLQLLQGPDGNIYQLDYRGELSVIAPSGGNRAPKAVISATPDQGYADLAVQFSGAGSTDPEGAELTYLWDFGDAGDADTSTAVTPTWTYTENGSYLVTLTVTDAGGKTNQATHQIVVGSVTPTIDTLTVSQPKYNAGDTITFTATASDADDGALDSSAYHWRVLFRHADHIHPFADDIVGPNGSITIPRDSHNVDTTRYEIILTVTDSSGLSTSKSITVNPNLVQLQFTSNDPDAVYTIDGVPHKGTYTETAVVGVERVIGALPSQFVNGKRLVFGSWSDSNLPTHTIVTPATATTYVVTYDEYIAPKSPEPWSIPSQILLSQRANLDRLAGAITTSVGLRSAAPLLNAVTDVIAVETIRAVGAVAALASNVIPVTATVLRAPAEITNILVDTALALVQAAISPDGPAALGALDLVQVLLKQEVAEQQGLILGAFANLIDDVATAYAVPLPPPAAPGTQPIERSLTIANQVADSVFAIVRAAVAAPVHVASTATRGLQVFAAANPSIDLVPDWVAFLLGQIVRESTDGRHAVLEAIIKAGEDLSTAAKAPF
ncbi:PQQ-dependent sugar dehydrogenase [Mycobacterium sp. 3519A]|uniref:PQQ-dependent sugar dehydrogenase n=1 Tax=Mycobacterium sp. 3519A TaxID=2057184 RepID=UPI001158B9FA|nr:PQQ-dependent sugar dehydrogenase [Mycobacterium sp. 3519A]